MNDQELEELLERHNIPDADKDYYRDWYANESAHYPFGELGENSAPPPLPPKKKGWKINRDTSKRKRIL